MTLGNYVRICLGAVKWEHSLYRHTRLILSALTGKDSRELIPLPGDWDHVKAKSKAEINALLIRWGKQDWIN